MKVILTSNPQGVDIDAIGKEGTILKQSQDKYLISFANEFGECEEWYFTSNQFQKL